MHWIASSKNDPDTATRKSASHDCEATWRDFRRAKDCWRTNSGLKSEEYSAPVLGLLLRQIQNLRRTRDLLLPRLLSGQVELEKEAA